METEAKYKVPDEATFDKIKKTSSLGPYARKDPTIKKVHDRYLDTPERLFYDHKYFVRLREEQKGGPSLLTIKRLNSPVEGAIHNREEYQARVESPQIATWPEGEPKAIAQKIAGENSLTDFVAVDQTRTVSVLYDGTRAVAEMSLDEILTGSHEEPKRAYELEVELLPDGTMDDLKAISSRLEKQYDLAPQTLSKFERALLLSSPSEAKKSADAEQAPAASPPPRSDTSKAKESGGKRSAGLLPTDDMDTAARKLLAFYSSDLFDNEDGARKGHDPEALHDMRVATRRMRAVLRIFEPYLESEPATQLRRDLRSITQALGAVRDQDVLLENAQRFRNGLPESEQGDLEGLIAEWTDTRKKARKKLQKLLASKQYSRFKKHLGAYVKQAEEDAQGAKTGSETDIEPHQVRHVAGSAVWERYEAIRAFETIMEAPTYEQLHALRVKAKYLRYTLESLRDVLPGRTSNLISDIIGVQDLLGEMHDAVVAQEMIRSYKEKHVPKDKKGEAAHLPVPGLDKYLADRESTAQTLYHNFFNTWSNITGAKWRAKLAADVAAV